MQISKLCAKLVARAIGILGYKFSVCSKLSSLENIVLGVFLCLCGKGGKSDDPEAGTCFPRRQAVAAAADLNTRCCRLASFFAHAARHKGGASFFGVALDFQEVGDP